MLHHVEAAPGSGSCTGCSTSSPTRPAPIFTWWQNGRSRPAVVVELNARSTR